MNPLQYILSREAILALHSVTLADHLNRDALLCGIDLRFVAQMPTMPTESAQILRVPNTTPLSPIA
jgi:hypothetical protein